MIRAIVLVIGETVRELRTVPDGELYATFSDFISLREYQDSVAILLDAGLIRRAGNVLSWIES